MALKVGFIGLGIMGQPMAQNVVKGGHALTVYNRSGEKAKPFGDAGATVASTPKAVAQASDVIIMMLAGLDTATMLAGPMGCALFEFKNRC
jgi:3-hydroxyisobutyrate dehydrogenase-like beta-hydroxyacid dehydrogenase